MGGKRSGDCKPGDEMQDDEVVLAHVSLLPASISWHCCPKTCEKVTGPAAELEITGGESIAIFESFLLVMGLSPAALRSFCPSSVGRRRAPEQQRLFPSPGDAPFSLFKAEQQHESVQWILIGICIESCLPLPGVLRCVPGRSGGLRHKQALSNED